MQPIACPAVLVSAIASGQGKTLCTAALARAWRNRGLSVQCFKAGPDFLDPMVLAVASGRPVYNLDLGMCGVEDGTAQLYKAAQAVDVIIVEGVMGLYDGTPSSADLAIQFNLPVLVTIDASAMAQTFGAVATGLLSYNPALKPAGVIANKLGSIGHGTLLRDALASHPQSNHLIWFGALLKDDTFILPERHLGLHCAAEIDDLEAKIEAAAHTLADSGELPLPPLATFNPPSQSALPQLLAGKTIAIARDDAFCFIYPANLDCLKAMGATLQFFSPLNDAEIPLADAIWLPGGYPELHLDKISQNTAMKNALKLAAKNNIPILAECGGMMALSEAINEEPAFELLTGQSKVTKSLQGIGTQHVILSGEHISAHTFHYGVLESPLVPEASATAKYGQGEAVYQHGSITATFLHFYFPSNLNATAALFLR